MISWQKMSYNFSKTISAHPRQHLHCISTPRCEFRHVAFRNECNMINITGWQLHGHKPYRSRVARAACGVSRVSLLTLIVRFTDCYDRNSTKSSVNIHEAQIRQQMQTVNKARLNTSPDYCQRGNMVHVLLSVLIIKDLFEVAIHKMAAIVNSQWQGNIRLHCFHLFTAWHFLPSTECALTVCQWPHHLDWTRMNI